MEHSGSVEPTHHILSGLREFLTRPRLRSVFVLALGLELWWIVSSIYIPLAVVDMGFGPDIVGWVVTGGILPLVLLEPWVGRQARRLGTRAYLTAGFIILALGSLSFVPLKVYPLVLLVMFAAVNVGAALIEPLTDSYFFEVASDNEADRLFGLHNASARLANLFGPLLGAVVFLVGFGFNGIWVLTAVLLALCARVALGVARAR
jgi:MFS family permease